MCLNIGSVRSHYINKFISGYYNLIMEEAKAIKFIELTPEGEFCISSDAMNMLQELGDKKVAPIVIAGPWRSGKSFLANRFVGRMKGFTLGSTVKACTKGIWMWSKPIKLEGEDSCALILDAEGLNSTERSANTDTRLFVLSLLLSSLFVYNSRGHITETSIEDLALVTKLSKDIHVRSTDSEQDAEFYKYLPTFFWVLRDFSLDLNKKTPHDYLEDNLKLQPSEQSAQRNSIRHAITSYFPERDCFTLVRPVNEEGKLINLETMKYADLRSEFTKACDCFVETALKRVRVKTVNGVPLTASMYMGLALEYIQSLNDRETPTVLTALERVLLDEARKHSEAIFEKFSVELGDKLDPSLFPMEECEVAQAIDECKKKAYNEFIQRLHSLCSGNDLAENYKKFEGRIKVETDRINEMNVNNSDEKSKELLQVLFEKLALPRVQSTNDIKPTLTIEFTSEWSRLIENYYKYAKGPTKNSAMVEFIRQKLLESTGEIIKEVIDAYTDSENKLKLRLTELQVGEKRWKTFFENSEKLLAERTQEKDELMAKNSELELKYDQFQRELRGKDNDIKSLKNYQAIEISNIKQLNETMIKEKNLIIDDLNKKHEALINKLSELESENQKLQNENIRNVAQLKNHNKILELTRDGSKKSKSSQDQGYLASLYKNIKDSLDEFKVFIEDVEENTKLKKQVLDLQKEVNDKEFEMNKKILEMRKEGGNQLTGIKLEYESKVRDLNAEIDSLKQTNASLSSKLAKAELRLKTLTERLAGLQTEKDQMQEIIKVKDDLIEQYKTNLEEENKQMENENSMRQDVEMELSRIKVEWALIQEDTEALIDLVVEVAEKHTKKKLEVKDAIERIRNEKLKSGLMERLFQSGIKCN
eukprot:TRINITY_DN10719_c0_g1_i1.p1 TRINITY_DN10719_c0_g1~~TRINITY_DN10719_c0_g1_i1.p1  ORF type:complete len:876 (+),score=306.37 TRINITY_DN10719_c0_g1_i1:107-2734(+)